MESLIREKHQKSLGNQVVSACIYFNDPAMNASGAGRHGWSQMNSANLYGGGGVCARACMCAWACVRDVFAICDNNI